MQLVKGVVKLVRPAQWAKNILVLAGLVFSQSLGNAVYVGRAALALAIFCLLSASGYALNDLWDLEQDRRHPEKCKRPLPSGMIPPWVAVVVCIVTLVVGLGLALWLGRPWEARPWPGELPAPPPWLFFSLSLAYVALTFGYTVWLKHVVLLDLFAIAGCFVLRAAAGAAALPVEMSSWLFGCTLLLALFLAAGRRRAEIQLLKEDAVHHRRVIAEYTPKLLDQIIAIVTSATLISYVLYTMWPATVQRFGTENLKYTVPFVLYGLFRYLYRIYRHEEGGQPEATLFKDLPLIIDIVVYILAVLAIIYVQRHTSIRLP